MKTDSIQPKSSSESKKSTGRGGYRPGAGRKKGSATQKTREIADRAAESGITPLEFMLNIMRAEPSEDLTPGDMLKAIMLRADMAKAAAPYIHPRLQAIEHAGPDGQALNAIPPVLTVTIKA